MWAVTVLEGLVDWYKNFLNTLPLQGGALGPHSLWWCQEGAGPPRSSCECLSEAQRSHFLSLLGSPSPGRPGKVSSGLSPSAAQNPGNGVISQSMSAELAGKARAYVYVCVCVCRLCACEREKERECVEGWMKSLPARVGKSCHCKSSDHFWFGCSCFPLVIPSVVSRRRWKKPSVKSFSIRRPLNCVSSSEIRVCCTQSFQLIYSWTLKSFCPKMPKREGTIFF